MPGPRIDPERAYERIHGDGHGIDVRDLLETELADVESPVAVALSGGIDSASVLFALNDLGVDVTAYTFHLQNHESTDLRRAERIAEYEGVPHVRVPLPVHVNRLKRDVWYLVHGLGCTSKTSIECVWPFLYLCRRVASDDTEYTALVTGSSSDGHFVVSRSGLIDAWNPDSKTYDLDKMREYRENLYSDPDYAQEATIGRFAEAVGIPEVRVPYAKPAFFRAFRDAPWREINEPHQKQPIRDAYPERFTALGSSGHTNLQLGDSGIADAFTALLDTDWNAKDYDSVTGVYNAVERKNVPRPRPIQSDAQ